eukprot:748758-Hanusia_phi.AAC.1
MARYAVKLMDDGSITVDAPSSAFPPSGFFTLFHPKKEGPAKDSLPPRHRACCRSKPYSFHKYVEQSPYTKDHFAIKKEEENANWTCLIAVTGKDGEVFDDRCREGKFNLPHLGLPSLGKKGLSVYPDRDGNDRKSLGTGFPTDKEILDNVFVVPGLDIPLSATPEEPNLRCRMYRNKYPDVEETVVVLVKRIDVMGVYVSLVEYDDTEGDRSEKHQCRHDSAFRAFKKTNPLSKEAGIIMTEDWIETYSDFVCRSTLEDKKLLLFCVLTKTRSGSLPFYFNLDMKQGYIDLSKRRVSPEDVEKIEEKFNKSKSAHRLKFVGLAGNSIDIRFSPAS